MTTTVRVPEERSARVPAEQRGPGRDRDSVRLLVSCGTEVSHHAFVELPRRLRAGDLLIVNTSPTLAAAVDGRIGHARVVVHFSTRGDDGRWAVELRDPDGKGTTRARAGGPVDTEVRLAGDVRLVLEEPLTPCGSRLWWGRVSDPDVLGLLRRHGRPIRYSYTWRDQPLSVYQTVFALPSAVGRRQRQCGDAERGAALHRAPGGGAGEPGRAVRADHAAHRCRVGGGARAPVSGAVRGARGVGPADQRRASGRGRILAVGTTAVRAVESAVDDDGVVRARKGWTDLVVTPERGVRVVDGLLTGLHEPEASHLLMLEAIAGRAAIERGYAAALSGLYLWHEFGDVHLVLPEEGPHAERCSSNCR